MPWLINASQLDKFRKSQKNVSILDATWHHATENRNAQEEFLQKHIIGAKFFDVTTFCDTSTSLPNMLLRDEASLSEKIGALGITNEHKIIFYDNTNNHSSCRALWMFKVFGHNPQQLYILNGGFNAWQTYGGKTESGEPKLSRKQYQVTFQSQYIRTLMQMKNNCHQLTEQVVDVRNAVRYAGGPEKKPNLRSGHIPESFSFPFTALFEQDGSFKSLDKISKQLTGVAVNLNAPIISTCGSGMTAPILNFVLDLMNHPQNAVYDGSWSEWGLNELLPGEKDLSERPVETSLDS